jgi:Flp pilus assembly protein TadD
LRTPTPRPLVLSLAALVLVAGCAGARGSADSGRRVRLALAEQLAAQGDWSAAFHAADALHREAPGDTSARLLRARALRHSGALEEAEADLREVLEQDPSSAVAHGELAVLCEQARRPEEALVHHREALRLEPKSPRYLNNLGFALLVRGRPREAIPLLEAGLRIAPGDQRLRNNAGFALAAAGDFAGAARQFELAGTSAQARNNLGLAYERAGNLPQAYEQYLEALKLDPAAATPRRNLEHVSRELGRTVPELHEPTPAEIGGS